MFPALSAPSISVEVDATVAEGIHRAGVVVGEAGDAGGWRVGLDVVNGA